MKKDDKIYVAGHLGMVGSAICRRLIEEGFSNLITRSHSKLDLTINRQVDEFFAIEKPKYVFLAAAKVGGILSNQTYSADYILENLKIQTNVIELAWRNGVRGLQFMGSACIYPRLAPQPIKESSLLAGPLEPTNEMYAIAKIAGLKLCEALHKQYGFNATSIMPTNLYGPGDNFNLRNCHVLPALIRKFHDAKISDAEKVEVWGSGKVFREFLHVDDMASAAVFLMSNYRNREFINVGSGEEVSIKVLAEKICNVVGYQGKIVFNTNMPDGVPRKLLDSSRLRGMGWAPSISLSDGLENTYRWFVKKAEYVRN